MNGRSTRLLEIFLSSALALVPIAAAADKGTGGGKGPKARIAELAVDVEERQVLASFKLTDAFDDNIERRLESGLATSIVFDFELVRKRRLWFNKKVEKGEYQVVAMYNALNREYLVNYKHDGQLTESRLIRDAAELYTAMTEFEKLAIFSLAGKKGEYTVRTRAELGKTSVLFFIPRLRTTDWAEQRIEVGENGRAEDAGE